ncbi:MAG TPA: hypothetical protein VFY17_11160 [Pilimelia sp.]|nr:hypothetical protein [Pilimelia sp.]
MRHASFTGRDRLSPDARLVRRALDRAAYRTIPTLARDLGITTARAEDALAELARGRPAVPSPGHRARPRRDRSPLPRLVLRGALSPGR